MKIIRSKWKLFFYAMGAMGVNMLNLVIGSYLCDALMTKGFDVNIDMWTYANKTLVVAAVWSIMITIAKVIDGVIDIPLASLSDNLRTKWGRRRPAILMGLIPMILAYVAFLNPVSGAENSLANTIYLGIMLCLFYTFYTLTMGTYYATFSEIVDNDRDRVTLSNFKTVFDVVYFVLGYGLIPVMISAHLNIRIIGYIFLPLVLTMLIPIFMIKEKSNLKKDVNFDINAAPAAEGETQKPVKQEDVTQEGEHVNMLQSLKYVFTNKSFVLWMVVYAALQFGLQMYLTGQNVYYSGTMKLEGWQITVLMAAVFAPVPATLLLYNHLVKKKGLKAGFLFSLIMFTAAMACMALCRPDVIPNETVRLVVAIVGSIISSFGIGCFFSISYTVPSALADLDLKEKGVSHPTMFFAIQGLASGVATAIATGVIWVNVKDKGFSWLLPILVIAACLIAIGLTFLLPKGLGLIGRSQEQPAMESAAEPVEESAGESAEAPVPEAEEEQEMQETAQENSQDDSE